MSLLGANGSSTFNLTGDVVNNTSVGATNTSTGAFTTLASSTSLVASTASASNTLPLQGVCSAAGSSTGGPTADLFRNGASANGNISGQLVFSMLSSTSAKAFHAGISSSILSNTNGAVSGSLQIFTLQGGTQKNVINTTANGGQYQGNNTNTASPAGYIGEVISSSVTAFSLTTGTQHNLTTISLTAGSWIISGSVGFVPAGTLTMCAAGNGSVSASFTTPGLDFVQMNGISSVAGNLAMATPTIRALLSATTTYYLVATANFSSTCTANGAIFARRIG